MSIDTKEDIDDAFRQYGTEMYRYAYYRTGGSVSNAIAMTKKKAELSRIRT